MTVYLEVHTVRIRIGDAAARSGLSATTLRKYAEEGLEDAVPEAQRAIGALLKIAAELSKSPAAAGEKF